MMKRMFKLLIVLFILYFGIQYLYYYLGKGHEVSYIIISNNSEITINEKMTSYGSVSDGYYFDIKFDNYSIPFKILKKFNKQKRIVSNVNIYYGDIYTCAEIKLKKDENVSDIKCIKNDIVYFYNTIRGKDAKLDNLISQTNYEILNYIEDTQSYDKDRIKYFPNNFIGEYIVSLTYYKGIYSFGSTLTNNSRYIPLFVNDQYNTKIEGIVDKYYIIADYNSSSEFTNFTSINMENGASASILSTTAISFSSYIEGSMDGKLYLIDTKNKKQYTINPKKKTIELVGDENTGALVYKNNGWVTQNMNEVIDNKVLFYDNSKESIASQKYDNLKLVGNEYGIYYYYVKNGSMYDAYMIYAEDINQTRHYLFSLTDLNRIRYKDDVIFYVTNDEIKSFGPRTGIRTILKFSELKYNSDLIFYIN